MSLLDIIDQAVAELGLDFSVSLVMGSDDPTVNQLRRLAVAEGKRLARKAQWPDLVREHTFATVASTASYALPSDYESIVNDTAWDRTAARPLEGPLSPAAYQNEVSGLVQAGIVSSIRLRGGRVLVVPTPTGASTLAYEYVSNRWCSAAAWAATTVYAANATISSQGRRYTTTGGGTSGSTAPTHTSGSASDGGVTWAYADNGYREFVADTDVTYLDEDLMVLGIKWRFLKAKELAYAEEKDEYDDNVRRAIGRQGGRRVLDLAGRGRVRRPYANLPETGYGS